jgi:hypothetical protein
MPVLTTKTAKLDTEVAGNFRAQVCLSCGFTEWYATDLQRLAALATTAPNARVVETSASSPYR